MGDETVNDDVIPAPTDDLLPEPTVASGGIDVLAAAAAERKTARRENWRVHAPGTRRSSIGSASS